MVLLPVVARELRVAARGRATYRVRFWPVLVVLGLLAWALNTSTIDQNSGHYGVEVMSALLVPSFVFCLFIGVMATSDCVSVEKREGTLGLLFLTDLKGYDVICGKLAANSLNAVYGLLAILPVLAMPVLLGGVSFVQYLKLALVLVTMMVLSLAVGIFVSTCSRNERKAMFFTVFLLLTFTVLPPLMGTWYDNTIHPIAEKDIWKFMLFSPAFGLPEVLAPAATFPGFCFWLSVAWQWLVAGTLIAWASARVPHSWEETRKRTRAREKKKPVKSRVVVARKWLERNPFLWLAMQGEEASPRRVWLFVLTMFVIWIIAALKFGMGLMADQNMVLLTALFLHIPLKVWVAAEALRRFSEDRCNNTFEFILSTPLTEWQIIQGQCLALWKQFAGPILFVMVCELCLTGYIARHPYGDAADPLDCWPKALLLGADSVALAWAGMWYGLFCKGRIRALLSATTMIMFAPWLASLLIVSVMRAPPPAFTYFMGTPHHATFINAETIAKLTPSLMVDLFVFFAVRGTLPLNFRRMAIRR